MNFLARRRLQLKRGIFLVFNLVCLLISSHYVGAYYLDMFFMPICPQDLFNGLEILVDFLYLLVSLIYFWLAFRWQEKVVIVQQSRLSLRE